MNLSPKSLITSVSDGFSSLLSQLQLLLSGANIGDARTLFKGLLDDDAINGSVSSKRNGDGLHGGSRATGLGVDGWDIGWYSSGISGKSYTIGESIAIGILMSIPICLIFTPYSGLVFLS